MANSFIFVRHGQSQANADGIIAGAHAKLTQNGIEQARTTANEVKGLGIKFVACSPYLRAQQTAETIAGVLGIDLNHIKIVEELRERGLGELEGNPKNHPGPWYTQADAPTLETKQHLLDRMNDALYKLAALADGAGRLLVVGHAISGFYLVEAAKGIRTVSKIGDDAQLGNADYVEIEFPKIGKT